MASQVCCTEVCQYSCVDDNTVICVSEDQLPLAVPRVSCTFVDPEAPPLNPEYEWSLSDDDSVKWDDDDDDDDDSDDDESKQRSSFSECFSLKAELPTRVL